MYMFKTSFVQLLFVLTFYLKETGRMQALFTHSDLSYKTAILPVLHHLSVKCSFWTFPKLQEKSREIQHFFFHSWM